MIHKIYIFAVALFAMTTLGAADDACAQDTRSVIIRLGISNGSAKINVVEHGSVGQTVIKNISSRRKDVEVDSYRVRIFYDNNQYAREGALAARERFTGAFPGIPTFLDYQTPYYRVTVGNCLTKDEVTVLYERVKGMFDRAFITTVKVHLSEFSNSGSTPTNE